MGETRRVPMRPVMVIEVCDCGADLPSPSSGITRGWDTQWVHRCGKCGEEVSRPGQSGRIVYEEVPKRQRAGGAYNAGRRP